jgi:hypothetical protein
MHKAVKQTLITGAVLCSEVGRARHVVQLKWSYRGVCLCGPHGAGGASGEHLNRSFLNTDLSVLFLPNSVFSPERFIRNSLPSAQISATVLSATFFLHIVLTH